MNYANIATRLRKYIQSRGKTLYIIRKTETGGEDWNPVTEESTPIQIKGIQSVFKKYEIDGEIIQRNDKKYLVTDENEIKIADKIRDNGHDLSVIDVIPVDPGGTTIINIIQARK